MDPLTEEWLTLVAEIEKLRQRVAVLGAIVRLLLALVRTCGYRLDGERLPAGKAKSRILLSWLPWLSAH